MNITTIIELDNQEVEKLAGAKMVFVEVEIMEDIVETCVNGFEFAESGEVLETDEAMQKVFKKLKEDGIVPSSVYDFSYEMPSCGRIKSVHNEEEIPQNVIISYVC